MTDRVGQQLGSYRLLRLLGEGGFAHVYLGEHVFLKTHAAVKVLHRQETEDALVSFLREAQTIACLEHPNIVRVLDFGVEGKVPFLVMSYAANGTLRQRHCAESRLPLTTITAYLGQVAAALQYAHTQKLIHRDVKPQNMLIGLNDEVLLSDFGLAIMSQSTSFHSTQDKAGTLAYMAPEQFQGKPRPASDQYALGVVVYEWLCGERPFHGNDIELAMQHQFAVPPPLHDKVLNIPAALEQVVLKALEKDPHKRFASVQEFAAAFELAGQAVEQFNNVVPASQPSSPAQASPSMHTEIDVHKPGLKEPALSPTLRDEALLAGRGRVPTWRRRPLLIGLGFIAVVAAVLVGLLYPMLAGLVGTHPTTMTPPPYAPMFGFNLQHTRFNPGENKLTTTNVSRLMQDWKAPTGAGIYSSPAVDNGIVYVGSDDGKLYAFKADTGTLLWSTDVRTTGKPIRSSPAVVNGVVYVGSDDGKLYAFDATSGRPLWFASTGNSIRSSPTVANGKVYIGSKDHTLYAFNAGGCGSNNTPCPPLWTASTGSNIYYSSPAVVNGIVYIGSQDHYLYAFDANNGKFKWKALTGGPIDASPAVFNGVVYISSEDGTLDAFDAGSGTAKWHVSTGSALPGCQEGSNRSSPAVANGVVYVGSDDGKLHVFDTSGKLLWTAATGRCVRSSPGVANGVVYVGSDDHILYTFNASGCGGSMSCSPLWKYTTRKLIFSSPVVVNGVVYVGSADNNLYAFHLPGATA